MSVKKTILTFIKQFTNIDRLSKIKAMNTNRPADLTACSSLSQTTLALSPEFSGAPHSSANWNLKLVSKSQLRLWQEGQRSNTSWDECSLSRIGKNLQNIDTKQVVFIKPSIAWKVNVTSSKSRSYAQST